MQNNELHEPVLVDEIIQIMKEHNKRVIVDATCGNGGHSLKMAQVYGKYIETLLCFEKDPESIQIAKERLSSFNFIFFFQKSYSQISDTLNKEGKKADFIIFDLGLSMWQIKSSKRGFTFKKNEKLDMRFNTEKGVPLFTELQRITPQKLESILKTYGDVKSPKRIANYIVKERKRRKIQYTRQLTQLLKELHIPEKEIQKIFMALRIYNNDEIRELSKGIESALKGLKNKGIIAIITYHSVEDRIVKKIASLPGITKIKPYPIKPSVEEVNRNRAARSAKLRAFIKGENYVEETAHSIFGAVVSSFPSPPYRS